MNKKLNIFILTKDRELQLKALLDSFFSYSKKHIPLKVTVFFDNNNNETWFHRHTFERFKKEIGHFDLINADFTANPPVLERHFVQDEYNLVLPDSAVFTQDFDLSVLEELNESDILDLFKGMNRQKNSIDVQKSSFLSDAGVWERKGSLYFLEKEGDAFEQLRKDNHFRYYGKIFVNNDIEFSSKRIFFYAISPCFINAINEVHPFIDFYDIDTPKEYNPYAFSVRYSVGEHIDIDEMNGFSPNSLMYQYRHKFKKSSDCPKLKDLVSHALYINLDHREDRRQQIEEEIKKLNLEPLRIASEIPSQDFVDEKIRLFKESGRLIDDHSINLAKSRISCTLSHLKAIRHAKDNNWDYVLILEDDCFFADSSLQIINAALAEIHRVEEFDILYLGSNIVIPFRSIATNLAKIEAAWCMHAYILPKHMYDIFLNFEWNNHLTIDSYVMSFQNVKKSYITCPLVANQRPSYSDIEQKNVDYTHVIEAYFAGMLNKAE